MIITRIESLKRILPSHPELKAAVQWLQEFDKSGFDPGTSVHGVNPDFQYFTTKPLSPEDRLEAHRRNIDVHYIYGGAEVILVKDIRDLTQIGDYDAGGDYAFYEVPEGTHEITLEKGEVAILFPEDGHKAWIAVTDPVDVKKIVIKVGIKNN